MTNATASLRESLISDTEHDSPELTQGEAAPQKLSLVGADAQRYGFRYMAALVGQNPGYNMLFLRFPRGLWMCKTLVWSPFPLKDANTSPWPPYQQTAPLR